MVSILTSLLAGPLIQAVLDLVKKHIDAGTNEADLKADVEKKVLETVASAAETQAKVIEAENKSPSRITREWRPYTAIACIGTIVFWGLIEPIGYGWLGLPSLKPPAEVLNMIFQLCGMFLGVYGVSRTVEKVLGKG